MRALRTVTMFLNWWVWWKEVRAGRKLIRRTVFCVEFTFSLMGIRLGRL